MPGKKENESSYSFMSAMAAYRSVVGLDVATQAGIDGVLDSIQLAEYPDSAISVGRGNVLILGVLFPDAVTSVTVQVFVALDMVGGVVANTWALVGAYTIAVSGHIVIRDIYPGEVKILVTAKVGAGDVDIVYSRSA